MTNRERVLAIMECYSIEDAIDLLQDGQTEAYNRGYALGMGWKDE